MKNILLFGTGKSATVLISYLIREAPKQDWTITLVDQDIKNARKNIGHNNRVTLHSFDIKDDILRKEYISKADLVISLLPASLHLEIAQSCIQLKKHLFTPSYLSPEISALAADIKKANILFMGEMGLDPGIDHMSAMKAIHRIRMNGGTIIGFESLCGALVAPESDDNPWHYKISWSPGSLITAGKQGASYRKNRQRQTIPYEKLFGSYNLVNIPQLGQLAYYPNRDSERYAGLYQLEDVPFILRATLRHPDFCKGWQTIVNLGLTDTSKVIDTQNLTYKDWSVSLIEKSGTAEEKREIFDRDSLLHQQFSFLNLLNKQIISSGKKTAGALLLDLLSQKLSLGPEDKDMIVMLHRITFRKNNTVKTHNSLLITKGENNTETAIAKTVGLPLGILTKFLLNNKIHLTGLHIPTLPEIYLPVLEELEREGLRFIEYGDKV